MLVNHRDDSSSLALKYNQPIHPPPSTITPLFSLVSKLFSRIHPLLRDSVRAASVVISATLNSRYSTTGTKNMAPAVINGAVDPHGTNSRAGQSSKMHSKVASLILLVTSLRHLSISTAGHHGHWRGTVRP
jgi:hypothetical protein